MNNLPRVGVVGCRDGDARADRGRLGQSHAERRPREDRCVVVDVDDGDADAHNPEVRHRSHGHVEPDALLLPVSAFLLPVYQRRRRGSDAVAA